MRVWAVHSLSSGLYSDLKLAQPYLYGNLYYSQLPSTDSRYRGDTELSSLYIGGITLKGLAFVQRSGNNANPVCCITPGPTSASFKYRKLIRAEARNVPEGWIIAVQQFR